jgi:hypothetical protein
LRHHAQKMAASFLMNPDFKIVFGRLFNWEIYGGKVGSHGREKVVPPHQVP